MKDPRKRFERVTPTASVPGQHLETNFRKKYREHTLEVESSSNNIRTGLLSRVLCESDANQKRRQGPQPVLGLDRFAAIKNWPERQGKSRGMTANARILPVHTPHPRRLQGCAGDGLVVWACVCWDESRGLARHKGAASAMGWNPNTLRELSQQGSWDKSTELTGSVCISCVFYF
jgi:hypothetical protein